jgi:hypothetical protein
MATAREGAYDPFGLAVAIHKRDIEMPDTGLKRGFQDGQRIAPRYPARQVGAAKA